MKYTVLTLMGLTLLLLVSGCFGEKKPAGFPKIYPCSVVLKQENEPLVNAMVIFFTETEEYARWSIAGSTDANGVAVIATEGKFPGSPVGNFKVLVTKQETERTDITRPGDTNKEYKIGNTYSYVPLDFAKRDKTTLTATVVKGKNNLEFDLGKKVKIRVQE